MNESGREFALHVMVALIKEEGSVAVTVCVWVCGVTETHNIW